MTRAATAGAARLAQPLLGGEPSRKNALPLAPTSARCRRDKQRSRLAVQKRLVGPHEAPCLRHPSSEEVRTRAEIPFSLPSRRRARRARQARHRSSGPMGKRVATHHPHVRLRRDTAATRPDVRPLAQAALRAHASARAQPRGSTGFSWEDVELETGWWSTAGKLQRVYGLWQRLPAKSKQSPYAPCAAVRLRVAAAATGAPAGVARASRR
jgi:hypothetical protein